MNDLTLLNERLIRSRTHIQDDFTFIKDVVLNRNHSEYPDPFVSEVEDYEILINYLKRISKAIKNYNPKTESEKEKIKEFHNREQNRINLKIGQIKYPEPHEFDLSTNFIQRAKSLCFRTGYLRKRDINWNILNKLYNFSIKKLRYLSGYFLTRDLIGNDSIDKIVRVINSIRYVRGDKCVSVNNFIVFTPLDKIKDQITIEVDGEPVELENGVPRDIIKKEINRLNNNIGESLNFALGLANIGHISNYHSPNINNGVYNQLRVNFSERIGDKDDTAKFKRNIFAHEIYHSIQDVLATKDMANKSESVDLDESPESWDSIKLPNVQRNDFEELQKEMKQKWFMFRQDPDELCNYQTKNFSELFAVAFEIYVEDPELLSKEQPIIYELISKSLAL